MTAADAGDAVQQAAAMLDDCARSGQCARRVPDDALAAEIRACVRRLARERGLRIRTARLDDAVVVVRVDATVWGEDAATMRRKLTP